MSAASREQQVTDAFVGLAGALVGGEDVLELLELLTRQCAELLDIASAGMLLADRREVLHVMAASSTATRDLEVLQVQRAEGPCQDCYLGGVPVLVEDLEAEQARWPVFSVAGLAAGFRSVHAVPMRLRARTLGALGLFGTSTGSLNDRDLSLAQAMADVASIALTQSQDANDHAAVNGQLQNALSSRVTLEQAKGVLANHGDLDMRQAFEVLRWFSRDRNLKLSEVAQAVVSRALPAAALLEEVRARRS